MTNLLNLKKGVLFDYIEERVTRAQFTDGGATAGTYTIKSSIPVGAYFLAAVVTNVTGFIGDTSAALTIGDGTDVDRYNTGTPTVFTTANTAVTGIPSGVRDHAAAISPVLTVTSAADFTNVTAGALTVRLIWAVGG
jgi:hypothetical protein